MVGGSCAGGGRGVESALDGKSGVGSPIISLPYNIKIFSKNVDVY